MGLADAPHAAGDYNDAAAAGGREHRREVRVRLWRAVEGEGDGGVREVDGGRETELVHVVAAPAEDLERVRVFVAPRSDAADEHVRRARDEVAHGAAAEGLLGGDAEAVGGGGGRRGRGGELADEVSAAAGEGDEVAEHDDGEVVAGGDADGAGGAGGGGGVAAGGAEPPEVDLREGRAHGRRGRELALVVAAAAPDGEVAGVAGGAGVTGVRGRLEHEQRVRGAAGDGAREGARAGEVGLDAAQAADAGGGGRRAPELPVAVEARREEAVARGEHGEVLLAEGDVRGREAAETYEWARRAQLARARVEGEARVVAPEAEQRVGRGEDDGGVGGAPGHGG